MENKSGSRPSFIVIGAGVIGASIAYRLARGGADVTILEANEPGSGTSATSFAWVNAHDKAPRAYHDLNVAGMRAHKALHEALNGDWLHIDGSIEWRAEADQSALRQNVERLISWDYAVEWLSHAEALRHAPQIDPESLGNGSVAYFPDEGWVEPAAFVKAMIDQARLHGVGILRRTKVVSIISSRGRVTGVVTDDGARHHADVVVNCTGRWADSPVFPSELRIPMAPSHGLLVYVDAPGVQLSRILYTPRCHIRPDGANRLLVCRNSAVSNIHDTTRLDLAMPEVSELVREGRHVIPALGDAEAVDVKLGIRSIPADGLPVVGRISDVEGYYVAVTHSGVTLAPVIGALVADELLGSTASPSLADFRPERLLV